MALTTVGCRLNQYETERVAAELDRLGLQRVAYAERADLYILNTCTVTGRADADCRNLISRAYRKNPEAVIVVVGCYVEADRDRVAALTGVDLVVDNENKQRLPEILRENYPDMFAAVDAADGRGDVALGLPIVRGNGTAFGAVPPNRAMVKIGDGCNQHCSYCIVPKVRGRLESFPAGSIIEEVKSLIEAGYHEVVLTAVHIGKYGDGDLTLAGLVGRILDETTLARLRLSSLEPNELDEALIAYVTGHPRVCRHLHLPLQSGSDRILKLMKRPYSRGDYLTVIERVKRANDAVTIGCDLIVGFPGETDDDLADSLSVLDSGCLDYAHVFSYSDRPGTPASKMSGKIDSKTIKARNKKGREKSRRIRLRQMRAQIGREFGVISEGRSDRDGLYRAISDNYIKVKLPPGIGGGKMILGFKPSRLIEDESAGGPDGGYLEGDIV